MAKEYGAQHIGDVIVSAGEKKQTIPPSPEAPLSESDVTSAILKVTQGKVKTVCFVTGHGEKGLGGFASQRLQLCRPGTQERRLQHQVD